MLVVGDCLAAKPSARTPNNGSGWKRNFEAWLHGRQDCPELTTMDRKDFQTGLG